MTPPSPSSRASLAPAPNIMLAIYEKKPVSVDLYCPLHNYIVFNYSEREAQNLEDDLQTNALQSRTPHHRFPLFPPRPYPTQSPRRYKKKLRCRSIVFQEWRR
ncbi:Vacuolar-sorting protein BRO1 [Camellia lanceoleosa]|uniref:Vacuolar-sorting protein BRO1 n=1 Tax=Camellia lanceoleosa TaxID=1840588 RepID=A0ACC0I4Q1_9ERIC|nr:Vacuolar-sorting protein BRO1 [Camellia lanceoleosa]